MGNDGFSRHFVSFAVVSAVQLPKQQACYASSFTALVVPAVVLVAHYVCLAVVLPDNQQ
jgi:hypothetical protein